MQFLIVVMKFSVLFGLSDLVNLILILSLYERERTLIYVIVLIWGFGGLLILLHMSIS